MSNRNNSFFISISTSANVKVEDDMLVKLADELRELDSVSIELMAPNQRTSELNGGRATVRTILVDSVELGNIPDLFAILQSWLSRDPHRTIDLQIGENKVLQPSRSGVYAIGDIIKIAPSIENQTITDDVQIAPMTPEPPTIIHPVSGNICRPF